MSAPHTDEEIIQLHRRLYELCDKPPMTPNYNEICNWQRFLFEMRNLEDAGDLSGRFSIIDLVAVMERRERERKGGVGWGRMPSQIITKDVERFKDMVLEERAKARRSRPRPQPARTPLVAGDTVVIVDTEPAADADAPPLSTAMADFLRENRIE